MFLQRNENSSLAGSGDSFSGQVRRHIWFSGRVQGVGFRYRAYYIAAELGLTGWVRNQWDGRVEMEVQGLPGDIDMLMDRMGRQRFIEIEDLEVRTIPCIRESGFDIAD